jgi:hypothetical protein
MIFFKDWAMPGLFRPLEEYAGLSIVTVAAPCFAFQAPRKQDIGPEDGNSIAY